MELKDYLREKTHDAGQALKTMKEERLPELGRRKSALETELGQINERISADEQKRKSLNKREEYVTRRLHKLHKFRDKLENERPKITDQLRETEHTLNTKLHPKRKETEKQISEIEHEINQLATERRDLEEEIRCRRIEGFVAYLSELQERLIAQTRMSKELLSKREMRKTLEEKRHQDPITMELWESKIELQKLLNEAKIQSVKEHLTKMLESTDAKIEQTYPGALDVESLQHYGTTEEVLYAYYDTQMQISKVFLPVSHEDWRSIKEDSTTTRAEAFLRLAWALGKEAGVSPTDCELKLGSHDWAIASFHCLQATLIGRRFSVKLGEYDSVPVTIESLPGSLEGLVEYEDSTC